MNELKSVYIDRTGDWARSGNDIGKFYLKKEVDAAIAELKAEIKRTEAVGQRWFERCMEARTENIKLKEENERLTATPEQIMKEVFDKCLIYPKEMVRLDDAYKLAVSLRKQKYKRCLAMAGWCEATALWCYQAANTLPSGFHATLNGKRVMIETDRLYNRFELLTKWSNRWMKLAEKFKEAK